ncbi:MAG TPA: YbaK/EbsC family protein [Solirubrobacteraceae bacterium]|nr:YbaK/EbsC family protein [Solirubrobacteraceae bacterium]
MKHYYTEPEREMEGPEAVVHFLDRKHASFELIEHYATYSAKVEATAVGDAAPRMAKTVVLHDTDGYRIAIIPADEHIDLAKVRAVFGASADLRLATEDEIAHEFPAFHPGALPPFRGLLGTPEVLDTRLLHYHRILCSAGDHRHTLKISPEEIQRVGEPAVADVCLGSPAER